MENKSISEELADLERSMVSQITNSIENNAPDGAPAAQQPEPTSTKSVEPGIPSKEVDVVEPPKSKPDEPVEDPKPAQKEQPKKVDPDALVEDWDSPSETVLNEDPNSQPKVDFSDVAKALGVQEIKTKDDLVKVVSEYKTKAEELEKRVSSVPKELEKAIEIANLGGNYLEYLRVGSVDWSKEDPVVLYENYVIDSFADENGNVDMDQVNEFLDSKQEIEKELLGKQLRAQYVAHQNQTKTALEQQARQERAKFESDVKAALAKIDNIAGFKLSDLHKDDLYKRITSGEDLRYSDVGERIVTAFLRKNFEKIDSVRKTQIRNAALRETLEQTQMPQLKTTVQPADPQGSKGFSFDDYIKDLETKKL